jgi:hypothetical protein
VRVLAVRVLAVRGIGSQRFSGCARNLAQGGCVRRYSAQDGRVPTATRQISLGVLVVRQILAASLSCAFAASKIN